MNTPYRLALLSCCLALAACGGHWTRPGATADQARMDEEACTQLAAEQFPVEMSSTDTSNRKDYTTRCTSHGNQTHCTARGTDTGGAYQHDRNRESRLQAVDHCMRSRGYGRS